MIFSSVNALFVYLVIAIFILILVMILLHFISKYLEYIVVGQLENKAKLDNANLVEENYQYSNSSQEKSNRVSQFPAGKRQTNKKRGKQLDKIVVMGLVLSTIFLPISFKFFAANQSKWMAIAPKMAANPPVLPSPAKNADEALLSYNTLAEYLNQKNWQAADFVTYKLLLRIAGEKARSRGYIDYDELDSLPCEELKKIDSLWRDASDGQQGFSAQQIIYNEQGQNWEVMYNQVKWAEFIDDSFVMIVDKELNWETRRLEYKAGMQPNYKNSPPGHLPVTIGLVRAKEFPQFAELCKF